ncbi:LysM domain-containing protein [Bacillaceae bacterium S4-13-58]
MEPFIHYRINQTEQGIEVVLYLNKNLTEFSDELGTVPKVDESNLKEEAIQFVKEKFPSLSVKTIKIMAGAMVLSALGIGAMPINKAAAAKSPVKESRSFSSSYTVSAGDTLYGIAARYGTTVDDII